MRTVAKVAVALALLTVPASVLAENRTVKPKPPIALTYAHFDGTNFLNAYARGPLDVDVTFQNNTSSKLDHVTVTSSAKSMAPQTFSIGPNGTTVVRLTDSAGLPSACSPSTYALTMTGGDVPESKGTLRLEPKCNLSATVSQPLHGTPDSIKRQEENAIFSRNTTIVGGVACGKPITIKTTVYNTTKTPVHNLHVGLFRADMKFGYGDSTVSVPAGGSTDVQIGIKAEGGYLGGDLVVHLADGVDPNSDRVISQGATISFSQLCQVIAKVE